MARISAFCEWLLRQSVVWGCLACFAFYVLVVQNLDAASTLHRLFAGQSSEIKLLAAGLFFMALASLAIKLFGVAMQFGALAGIELPPAPADGQEADVAHDLESHLGASVGSLHNSLLLGRLLGALNFVKQRRSADGLEAHLHRLEAGDLRRLAHGHAAVRMMAVAMLILGALGTVAGIPAAMASHASGEAPSLAALLSGLSVAMEPTLAALVLCMILAVAKFGVERAETRLLAAVGDGAHRQLLGRFRQFGADTDPHVASIRRMCEQVLESVESAAARHDAALSRSVQAASRRWEDMASAATAAINRTLGEALAAGLQGHAAALNEGVAKHAAELEGTLIRHAEILSENIDHHTAGLADALEHHAVVLTETEKHLAAENQKHLAGLEATLGEAILVSATRQEKLIEQSESVLKELQTALVDSAGTTAVQREQLIKHTEVLLKVVEATGQIRQLEDVLNRNLSSLASSHDFEQTAASLAAAVQLLAARIHHPLRLRDEIDLGHDDTTSQAA